MFCFTYWSLKHRQSCYLKQWLTKLVPFITPTKNICWANQQHNSYLLNDIIPSRFWWNQNWFQVELILISFFTISFTHNYRIELYKSFFDLIITYELKTWKENKKSCYDDCTVCKFFQTRNIYHLPLKILPDKATTTSMQIKRKKKIMFVFLVNLYSFRLYLPLLLSCKWRNISALKFWAFFSSSLPSTTFSNFNKKLFNPLFTHLYLSQYEIN